MHILIQSLRITIFFELKLRITPNFELQLLRIKVYVNDFDFVKLRTVFELTVHVKHEMIRIWQRLDPNFQLSGTSN